MSSLTDLPRNGYTSLQFVDSCIRHGHIFCGIFLYCPTICGNIFYLVCSKMFTLQEILSIKLSTCLIRHYY